MRLSVLVLLSCLCGASSLVACTTEEYPNPPATRDGTEDTGDDTAANLPSPSNPPSSSSGGDDSKDKPDDATPTVGPTSGVDPDKTLGELGSSEKKALCDWQAGVRGGYGKKTTCEGGVSVSTPKNQAACLQDINLPSCQATVAEVEACIKVDAADPCAFAVLKATECEPLRACMQ
ncbi:MAG: hypothetical protein KF819_25355 [Labilithrix sp.]|nr:hypothetical protein [Labilithrix sp.]